MDTNRDPKKHDSNVPSAPGTQESSLKPRLKDAGCDQQLAFCQQRLQAGLGRRSHGGNERQFRLQIYGKESYRGRLGIGKVS